MTTLDPLLQELMEGIEVPGYILVRSLTLYQPWSTWTCWWRFSAW
ncbi:hypothetical protein Hanom_Chr16g01481711 [Helianthus anomalus]